MIHIIRRDLPTSYVYDLIERVESSGFDFIPFYFIIGNFHSRTEGWIQPRGLEDDRGNFIPAGYIRPDNENGTIHTAELVNTHRDNLRVYHSQLREIYQSI